MNKKYVIILAAACVVCLGAGVFIGGGLKENNLSATGASIGSVQNGSVGSEVDSILSQISDLQDKMQDIENSMEAKTTDSLNISNKIVTAVNTRGEVIRIIRAGDSANMPSSIYDNCNEIGVTVSTPGAALSHAEWKDVEAKIKGRKEALEAESDTVCSDLNALNEEHEDALNQMAALTQRLHDAMMRDRGNAEKAS